MSSLTFGSVNGGKNEIDLIDVGAIVILGFFAPMIFGVTSFDVTVFGGYDFNAALWTIGGTEISLAVLLTSGASGWVIVTNLLNSNTDHEPVEFGLIAAAIGAPLLFIFVPAFESLVMWHDMTQVSFSAYVIGATAYVSYKG